MGNPYVLVVDDDPDVRTLIYDALAVFGLEARKAGGGDEALAMIAQEQPRLIVLDLMMPKMTGFSVIAKLQGSGGYREIPIIVLSALAEQADHVEKLPGVVGAIRKADFSMEALRAVLVKAGVMG